MADLFEVCTRENSPLVQAGCAEGVVVEEFGLHNGFDMVRTASLRKIVRRAKTNTRPPRAVLMSPPCRPYCSLQNCTHRTKTKHRAFRKKRRGMMPIYKNCYELGTDLLKRGTELIVEQPGSCASWKRTALRDKDKVLKYSRRVLGCAVGLRDPQDRRRLMSKCWRFKTSSLHIAKALDGLDVCTHSCKHVSCTGYRRTEHSEHYPPELATKIINAVKTLPILKSMVIQRKRKKGRPRSENAMSATQRWRRFAGKCVFEKGKRGRPCLGLKPMTSTERSAKARGTRSKNAMSATQRWRQFAGKSVFEKGKRGRPCLGLKPMTSSERSAIARGT